MGNICSPILFCLLLLCYSLASSLKGVRGIASACMFKSCFEHDFMSEKWINKMNARLCVWRCQHAMHDLNKKYKIINILRETKSGMVEYCECGEKSLRVSTTTN